MTNTANPLARRAFVAGFGVGAVALGAGLASSATAAAEGGPARWQPTYNPQDDWMELPGKHRLVFDSVSPDGAINALGFVSNYIVANKDGYQHEHADLANIVVMRHFATPFGYTDAMWAKYGAVWGRLLKHNDPRTKKIAMRNTLNTPRGATASVEDPTIPMLVGMNVHFAICGAATKFISSVIARQMNTKPDDIYAELAANLVPNAHMVAAGIVAVNRAQERGYAFSYVG